MRFIDILMYIVLPVCSVLLIPLFKYIYNILDMRLKQLEIDMKTKISDIQTRQLLTDKLEPFRDDLVEIKQKMDKLIDRLLDRD